MRKCEKHGTELRCMAGCSAHPDNWYCPECEAEKDMQKMERTVTGLTESEQKVMDALVAAYNEFIGIERQHPSEHADFANGIHRLQEMLAVRVARRCFPKGWPIYSA